MHSIKTQKARPNRGRLAIDAQECACCFVPWPLSFAPSSILRYENWNRKNWRWRYLLRERNGNKHKNNNECRDKQPVTPAGRLFLWVSVCKTPLAELEKKAENINANYANTFCWKYYCCVSVRVCACVCVQVSARHIDRILHAACLATKSANIVRVESSGRFDIKITNAFLNGANYTFGNRLPSFDALQPSANQFDRMSVCCGFSWMSEENFVFDSVLVGKFCFASDSCSALCAIGMPKEWMSERNIVSTNLIKLCGQ